jgi:hypothetical protein
MLAFSHRREGTYPVGIVLLSAFANCRHSATPRRQSIEKMMASLDSAEAVPLRPQLDDVRTGLMYRHYRSHRPVQHLCTPQGQSIAVS